MVNKKGLLRIVESSIAVLIVLGVILVISVKPQSVSQGDLTNSLNSILEEIGKNNSIRDKIFLNETAAIEDINLLLSDKISNPRLDYSVSLCDDIYTFCGELGNYPEGAGGEVFSSERVISTNLNVSLYSPKKVKIYLWRVDS